MHTPVSLPLDQRTSESNYRDTHVQVAAEQGKAHRPSTAGTTQKTIGYYFISCYFYLNHLFLSRTIHQRNSTFMTTLVFYARGERLWGCYQAIVTSAKVIADAMSTWDKWFPKQASLHPASSMFAWVITSGTLIEAAFQKLQKQRGSRASSLTAPSAPGQAGFKLQLNLPNG